MKLFVLKFELLLCLKYNRLGFHSICLRTFLKVHI